MSILAAAGPSDSGIASLVPWMAIVLVAFAGAVSTGVFQARAVSGPHRLPAARGMPFRLLFAAAIGCFVWLLPQQLYLQSRHPAGAATQPSAEPESDFSSRDWVFLSTFPPLLAFPIVLAADIGLLGGISEVERLGLRRDPLPGAARGLLGILIASPMIWFVSSLTERLYEACHYIHPQEHELLKAMGDSTNPTARALLIIGAVILAPLFEEMIFRAHLQTFFRELFCRMSTALAATDLPINPSGVQPGFPFAEKTNSEPIAPASPPAIAWQTWAAIFLASALFTSVHPRWMWPPIFFLAICLGYAYERTGSLWTSIVMHSLFNATSTYLFLNGY